MNKNQSITFTVDGKEVTQEEIHKVEKERYEKVLGEMVEKSVLEPSQIENLSFEAGESRYCITYRADKILEDRYLIGDGDSIKAKAERAALKAMGIMANYIRLTGEVTLEHYENGVQVEVVSAPAIWEVMGFGLDEDV